MTAIGRPRRNGLDLTPDDPIVRRVGTAFASTQIDPLFRRRLRSDVVNRYVAVREGHLATRAAAKPLVHGGVMGRLGRACLYASVALAGSAAGVLAASQTALPGDVLYDVKLRIDALRLEAAPADLRATVAEYVVGERIGELTVLAADGEWTRATEAAVAAGAQAQSLAPLFAADPAVEARIQRHLEVLAGLLTTAPPAARDALEHAMAVSGNAIGPAPADVPHFNGARGGGANQAANGDGTGKPSSNPEGAANGSGETPIGGAESGEGAGDSVNGTGSGTGNRGGDATGVAGTSPVPSASAEDDAEKGDAQGGAGNADVADDHPAAAEPPSPTPRASIPQQANQDGD